MSDDEDMSPHLDHHDPATNHTTPAMIMNNSGEGPLQVPGFGSIPLDFELPVESRFRHGVSDWKQVPAVTVRELTMLATMNAITDEADWHMDIFNDEKVESWRQEHGLKNPLQSERSWAWCVTELRDKAATFLEKGYVRVLDPGACVCKSDSLVLADCATSLHREIDKLIEVGTLKLDQRNVATTSYLVDPLELPLMYGKSMVLISGGQLDLHEPGAAYSKAQLSPRDPHRQDRDRQTKLKDRWSSDYQCLPCEVEFTPDDSVQITSYINGLDVSHTAVYESLQTVLAAATKLWDACLIKTSKPRVEGPYHGSVWDQQQTGPAPMRIVTYGALWSQQFFPEWAKPFNGRYREMIDDFIKVKEKGSAPLAMRPYSYLKDYPGLEGMERSRQPTAEDYERAWEYLKQKPSGATESITDSEVLLPLPARPRFAANDMFRRLLIKHKQLSEFRHPEPGLTSIYDDWKTRKHVEIAVPMKNHHRRHVVDDHSGLVNRTDQVNLRQDFADNGLQTIISITSIDLHPSRRQEYHGTFWQLEAQMNEHIAATAVYVFDSHNITKSRLSFRHENAMHAALYRYRPDFGAEQMPTGETTHRFLGQRDELGALAKTFGYDTLVRPDREEYRSSSNCEGVTPKQLPVQELGSVQLRPGRLITYPNVLEHRWEPFHLADRTQPGRLRYITIHLVDPHYRICSTRNVPPQRRAWWTQDDIRVVLSQKGLPKELVDMIMECDKYPLISNDEANEVRRMAEHQRYHRARRARESRMQPPNFGW